MVNLPHVPRTFVLPRAYMMYHECGAQVVWDFPAQFGDTRLPQSDRGGRGECPVVNHRAHG
jgi:hypothetical protein